MRLFLLSIILCFGVLSYAQNWNLLNANKTYFYKHVDSLYITNTIKIDSTLFTPTDSTFYIHTRLNICDTCTIIPPDAVGGILYHAYAAEIFGNTPIYNVSSNDYQFSNGIIKQYAELSDSWTFNPALLINATVVNKYETTIIGIIDSVKVIELSTLDTIIISKNHGVIRYPDFDNSGKYFNLVGYHENQNSVGEHLPNFWRIYDFNVGDVFYYDHYHNWIDMDQCASGIKSKFTILNSIPSGSAISYETAVTNGYYEYCVWGNYYSEYTSSGLNYFYLDMSDAYYENNYSDLTPEFNVGSWFPDPFYYFHYSSQQVDDEYILASEKRHAICHTHDGSNYIKYLNTFYKFTDSLFYINSNPGYQEAIQFKEGFGRTYWEIYQFEDIKIDELVGWIKNNDTTGSVFQFADLNEKTSDKLIVSPNPANNQITIPANAEQISFYNLAGDIIKQINFPNGTLYIGDLPKGIYIVKSTDAEGHQQMTKLVLE